MNPNTPGLRQGVAAPPRRDGGAGTPPPTMSNRLMLSLGFAQRRGRRLHFTATGSRRYKAVQNNYDILWT